MTEIGVKEEKGEKKKLRVMSERKTMRLRRKKSERRKEWRDVMSEEEK